MRCEACGADAGEDSLALGEAWEEKAQLKGEIERLLLKHAHEQNILLIALDTAIKEIERLKEARSLLTECADALETSGPLISQSPLVRRVREATEI